MEKHFDWWFHLYHTTDPGTFLMDVNGNLKSQRYNFWGIIAVMQSIVSFLRHNKHTKWRISWPTYQTPFMLFSHPLCVTISVWGRALVSFSHGNVVAQSGGFGKLAVLARWIGKRTHWLPLRWHWNAVVEFVFSLPSGRERRLFSVRNSQQHLLPAGCWVTLPLRRPYRWVAAAAY